MKTLTLGLFTFFFANALMPAFGFAADPVTEANCNSVSNNPALCRQLSFCYYDEGPGCVARSGQDSVARAVCESIPTENQCRLTAFCTLGVGACRAR